ncbi:hypothetical protein ACE6H2_006583 [Prunus campanulata]
MGRRKGVVDFDELPPDEFDSANLYKDPVSMLDMKEGEHSAREVDRHREGQDHQRKAPLVLPHRGRQPPPEVPPPRPLAASVKGEDHRPHEFHGPKVEVD